MVRPSRLRSGRTVADGVVAVLLVVGDAGLAGARGRHGEAHPREPVEPVVLERGQVVVRVPDRLALAVGAVGVGGIRLLHRGAVGALHQQELPGRVADVAGDPVGPERPGRRQCAGACRQRRVRGRVHADGLALELAALVEAAMRERVARAAGRHRVAHRIAASIVAVVDPAVDGEHRARFVWHRAFLDAHDLVIGAAIAEALGESRARDVGGADLPGQPPVHVVALELRVAGAGQRTVLDEDPAREVVGVARLEPLAARDIDLAHDRGQEGVAPVLVLGADLVGGAAGRHVAADAGHAATAETAARHVSDVGLAPHAVRVGRDRSARRAAPWSCRRSPSVARGRRGTKSAGSTGRRMSRHCTR